jgi:flavin-binding protein dodecin
MAKQSQGVVKVIEVMGSSKESWADAADRAVRNASKTVKNITGVQVLHMTAQVKGGKITTYKTTVKVAFGVES